MFGASTCLSRILPQQPLRSIDCHARIPRSPTARLIMGVASRGPKLPKRSVIERLTKKGAECVPEMMTVLTCFKDSNFDEARCASQMRALTDCVNQKPQAKTKQKTTVFYHLKRLYYMQRR